jgi:cytochrome c553
MNTMRKRVGYAVVGLVGLVAIMAGTGYAVSESKVEATLPLTHETVTIPADSASIARGAHLAGAIAKCTDCHGRDLGGTVIIDNGAMGHLASPNLTRGRGGIIASLKDEDIVRAVRHAIAPDGRKLKLMPAMNYNDFSAEDLGTIIAYVKSVPAVDRDLGGITLGPVARGLIAIGKLPLLEADAVDHSKSFPPSVPVGPTAAYGNYLAHVGGCSGCHGPTFAGGHIAMGDPSWPPAANLTPTGLVAQRYTEEGFFTALRTGKRPDGTTINPVMPYKFTKDMTDDEIRAVWLYLQTVTPREFGAR